MTSSAQILGRGLAFPPRVGGDGRIQFSQGTQNVREAIRIVLATEPAERLRLPSFGAGLGRFLFEPNTATTRRQIQDRIVTALRDWEPRILLDAVDVEADPADPESARATITYRLVATQSAERVTVSVSVERDMAVPAPIIDRRSYQDIVDETLARIPVHNPEWTNHSQSDPGVTILELFAFIAESVVYRANRVPDRNRQKFLELLGIAVSPASSAQGIVTIANERGPVTSVTLEGDLEVRSGAVPFRTTLGLDVLPVEGRVFFKRRVQAPDRLMRYYQQLYASYEGPKPELNRVELYETVPLDGQSSDGVSLDTTADGSVWIALLTRPDQDTTDDAKDALRRELAGRTLNIGVVPILTDPSAHLTPISRAGRADSSSRLDAYLPYTPDGLLPQDKAARQPQYRKYPLNWQNDVLSRPGILQLTLPAWPELRVWTNLDPLEPGVGDFPPSLEDSTLDARVVTWIRLEAAKGAKVELLWAGVNATTITQRTRVTGEPMPGGTGEPGQSATLTNAPVIPDSVRLTVTEPIAGRDEDAVWTRIDDLLAAGSEVPVPDLRATPGTRAPRATESKVFMLHAAAGKIEFGDGERGRRPPNGSRLRVSYDYASGQAGNVGRATISESPALPAGFSVTNPVRTWGGADAETVEEGEKQAARFLQHRDRLVSAEDFESIVWRTPGIDLGRIEVLPTYNPELRSDPGDAAGAVTILVVPRVDAAQADAPEPDQPFLDAICDFLDPRRLVTTEVFLRGPVYRPIWVTVGFDIVAGSGSTTSVAVVRERVKAAIRRFLAPVDPDAPPWWEDALPGVDTPFVHVERGWPLGKAVSALEIAAVANKVDGVLLVRGVTLAQGANPPVPPGGSIPFSGLELPRLLGIDVAVGDPPAVEALRGSTPPPSPEPPTSFPVPVIPDDC